MPGIFRRLARGKAVARMEHRAAPVTLFAHDSLFGVVERPTSPAPATPAPDEAPQAGDASAQGLQAAQAMLNAGRIDEAEAAVADVLATQGEDHAALWLHAEIAASRQDHAAAAARWNRLRLLHEREPDAATGEAHRRAILAFSQAGQHDEARACAQAALALFPGNAHMVLTCGYAAQFAGDWETASLRWEQARGLAPDLLDGYVHGAKAYSELGRHDEALALLTAAEAAFPEHRIGLLKCQAYAAEARQDWAAAVRHWRLAQAMMPGDGEILFALDRALAQVDEDVRNADLVVQLVPTPPRLPPAAPAQDDDAALMAMFESLGENCEFGGVQRHYGAEKLGLFRWAGINVQRMIEGLETGFPHIGDPESTVFEASPEQCYNIRDEKTGFIAHTYVPVSSIDEARFRVQHCARLKFLRDKFLEDLRAAEKIFVFKPENGRVRDEVIGALHGALRRYGKVRLLCLRVQDGAHPAGSVHTLGDDVAVGYLGSVWDNVVPIEYDVWLRICRKVKEEVLF
jgi:tetratricopeptide (TPR) repeat protein